MSFKLKLNRIFTFLVILMPILNIYGTHIIPALRFGELILIPLLFFLLLNDKKIQLESKEYFFFSIYIMSISLILVLFISEYSIGNAIVRILRFSFYTIIALCMLRRHFDFEYGKEIYIKLSVITSIIVIIQFLILQATSNYLPAILPNMNLSYDYTNSAEYYAAISRDLSWYGESLRPSGLFLEPAHFCEYVIFSAVFLLWKERKEKNDYYRILIIIFAILVSRSAIGFIFITIIIVMKIFASIKKRQLKRKLFIYSILGIIFATYFVVKTDLMVTVQFKLNTITVSNASSGSLRVLRGFYIFNELPIIYKIFGIGMGNFAEFIESHNIVTFYDSSLTRTNEFMNAVSTILVYSGCVGLSLYLFALYKIFKKTKGYQKVFFVIFFILLFCTDNFFRESYMFGLIYTFLPISEYSIVEKNILNNEC